MTLPPKVPIHVTRRDGGKVTINGIPGKTLLLSLTKAKIIRGKVCHGGITCTGCHVFVEKSEGLFPDEDLMLANLEFADRDSRLACRVPITTEDAGMEVEIAPEEDT